MVRGEDYRAAIESCGECVVACEICAEACIQHGGMQSCVRACRDNIAIAATCMNFLARGSEMTGELCQLTSQACERCAASCGVGDSEALSRCADACRACATACTLIVSSAYAA